MLEHSHSKDHFQQTPFSLDSGTIQIGESQKEDISFYIEKVLDTSAASIVAEFELEPTDVRAIQRALATPHLYRMPGKLHLLETAAQSCRKETNKKWPKFIEDLITHLQPPALSTASAPVAAAALAAKGGTYSSSEHGGGGPARSVSPSPSRGK
jgi:hypothetical protein